MKTTKDNLITQPAQADTLAARIKAYNRQGLTYANGTSINTIRQIAMELHPGTVAEAHHIGGTLLLCFDTAYNEETNKIAADLLIGKAQKIIGTGWGISHADIFSAVYETGPFKEAVNPETTITTATTIKGFTIDATVPQLVRHRTTGEYIAIVRVGTEEEDIAVIRADLATRWEAEQSRAENHRYENAFELMRWLADPRLQDTPDEEYNEVLREEVGEERYSAMIAAAEIIRPLASAFLRPVEGWPNTAAMIERDIEEAPTE